MIKYSDIKNKVIAINQQNRDVINSYSFQKVIGVLSGLGFLVAPGIKASPNSKIDFLEALQFGLNIEPRILEVLPATIISFPRSFLRLNQMPEDFKKIVQAIKKRRIGPDFNGIKFEKFLEAANRPIKNRKRKTIAEKRQSKTFRLAPGTIDLLQRNATKLRINQTAYLELLINNNNY